MSRFDSRNGFVHFNCFGLFTLLVVWGWCGNCYPNTWGRILRIDWLRIGWSRILHVEYRRGISGPCTECYLNLLRPWRSTWNSEHLALRYGDVVDDSLYGPEHIVWRSRVFGYHMYL